MLTTLPRTESGAYQTSPPTHALPMQDFSHFQRPRPKARMASIWGLKIVAAEFGQLL
jgi:hypothetical protein